MELFPLLHILRQKQEVERNHLSKNLHQMEPDWSKNQTRSCRNSLGRLRVPDDIWAWRSPAGCRAQHLCAAHTLEGHAWRCEQTADACTCSAAGHAVRAVVAINLDNGVQSRRAANAQVASRHVVGNRTRDTDKWDAKSVVRGAVGFQFQSTQEGLWNRERSVVTQPTVFPLLQTPSRSTLVTFGSCFRHASQQNSGWRGTLSDRNLLTWHNTHSRTHLNNTIHSVWNTITGTQ